jgi:phosphoglycolate phosphatase-like HAD superfamily hydrolase
MPNPALLALDFDGVICDGLQEYFQTAWKAYCQIWQPSELTPTDDVVAAFYRLRPVIETGWEMPVLVRALTQGIAPADILADWVRIGPQILAEDGLQGKQVSATLDGIRDRWIESDLDSWLALHRFYPGVVARLQTLDEFVIISTKESRFIRQLLAQAGLDVSADGLRPTGGHRVYGKEQRRPKAAVLRELQPQYGSIWFIEDRFKTLADIAQQPDLQNVTLILADWGYNLPQERALANGLAGAPLENERGDTPTAPIHLISLAQFGSDFSTWCSV